MPRLLVLAALLFALPAHAVVNIEWVTVGDPGNATDTDVMEDGTTGYGSVAYTYRIAKFEVTAGQYVEFLNAVAAADPNFLWRTRHLSAHSITRSGVEGSYSYTIPAGGEDWPITYVSFGDAMRFANWLHNGQPTGQQDETTTEDGAYTITPGTLYYGDIARNAGARFFVPNENEWYKAAYYDADLAVYFDYPAASNSPVTCSAPGPTPNTGNCDYAGGGLVDVGSYTGSASPFGTFDQGGNAWEWTETREDCEEYDCRYFRGGDYFNFGIEANTVRYSMPSFNFIPGSGFRIASREYPVPALSPLGLLLVATGLLGFGVYYRGRG